MGNRHNVWGSFFIVAGTDSSCILESSLRIRERLSIHTSATKTEENFTIHHLSFYTGAHRTPTSHFCLAQATWSG